MSESVPVGTIIGDKYRITALRGSGAMAEIYEVVHIDLRAPFALKLARPEIVQNPELALRFENEARAAAKIQSDHVARVLDVGRFGARPYMVMELLAGEDLERLSARIGVLPVSEAVDYVLQALAALELVHAEGIVHRDLKPSNLFLHRSTMGTILKLVDFGVSTSSVEGDVRITQTGSVLGSPAYMSPEQLRSAKHVDGRADLWSVGVILYELLTGTMPFFGENVGAVFAAILEVEPPPPSMRSGGIPPGLDEIILKCLRRKPEERWSSAAELSRALEPWASAPAPLSTRVSRSSLPSVPSIASGSVNPGVVETISSIPPAATSIRPDASKRSLPPWSESVRSTRPRARRAMTTVIAAVVAASALGLLAWKLRVAQPAAGISPAAPPPSQTVVVVPVVPEPIAPVVPPPTEAEAKPVQKPRTSVVKDAGVQSTDEDRIFGRH